MASRPNTALTNELSQAPEPDARYWVGLSHLLADSFHGFTTNSPITTLPTMKPGSASTMRNRSHLRLKTVLNLNGRAG